MPNGATGATGATGGILTGCDFDAMTAKAVAGKDIIALVTDKTGAEILALAGQQSLSYNMSANTTQSATKDDDTGGWQVSFHGTKSWDASVDGLFSVNDSTHKVVAKALYNDEYLCLKICQRTKGENSTSYKPIRMGLAIVTSDNFSAGNEDNATYSMAFQGTGKPWLIENATDSEIAAATITVQG